MLWGVWRGHEGYLSLSGNRWGGARVYVRGASLDPRGLGREESSGDFDTWPTQCIVAIIISITTWCVDVRVVPSCTGGPGFPSNGQDSLCRAPLNATA